MLLRRFHFFFNLGSLWETPVLSFHFEGCALRRTRRPRGIHRETCSFLAKRSERKHGRTGLTFNSTLLVTRPCPAAPVISLACKVSPATWGYICLAQFIWYWTPLQLESIEHVWESPSVSMAEYSRNRDDRDKMAAKRKIILDCEWQPIAIKIFQYISLTNNHV